MDSEQLIRQTERLICNIVDEDFVSVLLQAREFLRNYGGKDNAFLKEANNVSASDLFDRRANEVLLQSTLEGFHAYLKNGLLGGITPERKAQLDVVSDFLAMSEILLSKTDVHPAAPAVLIGATLEEFLRTWVENDGFVIGNKKPGIESYSQILREADKLTKQDGKDITSWAGIRNDAAHGKWDEVNDRKRIKLMLEGVNLFMRKYFS